MTRPLTVTVPGTPIGQGNIRHLGKGRPAVHQNAKTLKPWRKAIVDATQQAMSDRGLTKPLDGPLHLLAVFTMPRGKTVKRAEPTVPPDLDHLLRALGDALKDAQAITDDARIVAATIRKRYETPTDLPGVSFFVQPTEEDR